MEKFIERLTELANDPRTFSKGTCNNMEEKYWMVERAIKALVIYMYEGLNE